MHSLPFIFAAVCLALLCVAPANCTNNIHSNIRSKSPKSEPKENFLYPFQNWSLSWSERVSDLVSRLTLDEKVGQMAHGGAANNGPAPEIPRLGIGKYQWGTECLSGDVTAGPATSFPISINMAATFDRTLLYNVARATSDEVRAKNNDAIKRGIYDFHTGLSCWSPVVNIARHPLWGRLQETYGESPYVSAEMAKAFVKGIQGDNERYVEANAGCKHFDAYAGPENIPVSRYVFDAKVSETDLRQTFLPAFEACVQAGTYSLMCSYNSINGVPACANKYLMNDIVRDEWKFEGYIVSDQGALECIYQTHNYTKTPLEAAAVAANAGTCLEDANYWENNVFDYLVEAVENGLVAESTIDSAVSRLFYTRMRLGEFDPPEMNPYRALNLSVVLSEEHVRMAEIAATKSMVLLKNDGILPLKESEMEGKTIAIIGPFGNTTGGLYGKYAPTVNDSVIVTVLDGITQALFNTTEITIIYTSGCDTFTCETLDTETVTEVIQQSDLVLLTLGTGKTIESEGKDRENLELPGLQPELLSLSLSLSPRVILALFNAGAVNVSLAVESERVEAILECGFPGQTGGKALADVVFGHSNPAARLPTTWPLSLSQFEPITDYSMEKSVTFRYFEGTPLFPFGYGLSYTTFSYSNLRIHPSRQTSLSYIHPETGHLSLSLSLSSSGPGERERDSETVATVEVEVENTGEREGEEIVQMYIEWGNATSSSVPKRNMIGFERVWIDAGKTALVRMSLSLSLLSLWNEHTHWWYIPRGEIYIYVGGQQPKQSVKVPSNVLMETVHIK